VELVRVYSSVVSLYSCKIRREVTAKSITSSSAGHFYRDAPAFGRLSGCPNTTSLMVAESSSRRRYRPSGGSNSSSTIVNRAPPSDTRVNHHYGSRFYWKLAWLLGVGLVFHLVYMLSIFDIYFRSPLVQGIEPVRPTAEPPAKRLVLFVGDGCRADKAFEMKKDGSPRMPFLHTVCKTMGSFGVSHTRVPTESRPGHIAMVPIILWWHRSYCLDCWVLRRCECSDKGMEG
jgi:hypothetical protein